MVPAHYEEVVFKSAAFRWCWQSHSHQIDNERNVSLLLIWFLTFWKNLVIWFFFSSQLVGQKEHSAVEGIAYLAFNYCNWTFSHFPAIPIFRSTKFCCLDVIPVLFRLEHNDSHHNRSQTSFEMERAREKWSGAIWIQIWFCVQSKFAIEKFPYLKFCESKWGCDRAIPIDFLINISRSIQFFLPNPPPHFKSICQVHFAGRSHYSKLSSPGQVGGKLVQFHNYFSLFSRKKWTLLDEFSRLFKRRSEIRLSSKRGRNAYIHPPTLF